MRRPVTVAALATLLQSFTCVAATSYAGDAPPLRAIPFDCGGSDGEPRRATVAGGSSVRLRVFNDAQAKAGILTLATNRVDDVYSQIRIRMRWTTAEPVTDDGMPLFDIVITNNAVPQAGTRPDRPSVNPILGRAYPTAHRAYAYYGRIEDAAFAGRSFTAEVLADVISHELGHLLLADAHSQVGIMRFDMLVKPGRRSRFDSREGNVIRQRVFAGGIGRRVINLEPCGSPLSRK